MTKATKFKILANRLCPSGITLQNLDDKIDTDTEILSAMLNLGQFWFGMATILIKILEQTDVSQDNTKEWVNPLPPEFVKCFEGLSKKS